MGQVTVLAFPALGAPPTQEASADVAAASCAFAEPGATGWQVIPQPGWGGGASAACLLRSAAEDGHAVQTHAAIIARARVDGEHKHLLILLDVQGENLLSAYLAGNGLDHLAARGGEHDITLLQQRCALMDPGARPLYPQRGCSFFRPRNVFF